MVITNVLRVVGVGYRHALHVGAEVVDGDRFRSRACYIVDIIIPDAVRAQNHGVFAIREFRNSTKQCIAGALWVYFRIEANEVEVIIPGVHPLRIYAGL